MEISVGYEVPVHQPLSDHAGNGLAHHGICVARPHVVAGREFVDIPMQVLRADVVESPVVAPLQGGPEGLDPVHVRLIPDIFGNLVADRLVVEGHAFVARTLVSVDLRAR